MRAYRAVGGRISILQIAYSRVYKGFEGHVPKNLSESLLRTVLVLEDSDDVRGLYSGCNRVSGGNGRYYLTSHVFAVEKGQILMLVVFAIGVHEVVGSKGCDRIHELHAVHVILLELEMTYLLLLVHDDV